MHRLHGIRMVAAAAMMLSVPLALTACATQDDRGSWRTVSLAEFAAVNNEDVHRADSSETRSARQGDDAWPEEQYVAERRVASGSGVTSDEGHERNDRTVEPVQTDADRMPPHVSAPSHMSDDEVHPSDSTAGPALDDAIGSTNEHIELYASSPPGQTKRQIVVESFVGQVSGRPIYADEFFEPIEDRLIAESQRASHEREFRNIAESIIRQYLEQIVNNELFLADARSQLTTEEQHGLIAMMRMMREEAVAQGGGTRTGADRRWQEMEGLTVEEYVEAQRDVVLLRELQRRKIQPRVIVSWRDIEREYQRRYDQYNPPALVRIGRIRLHTDRHSDQISEVKQRLNAGESFATVAESIGLEDGGFWQTFEVGSEGLAAVPVSETIRSHLAGLEVGDTSEPFEVGSSTWWLHIAEMDQPEGRSLYDPDVQREISHYLKQRRFREEIDKYSNRLRAQGIQDSEFVAMHRRLSNIAIQRYWR